MFSKYICAYPSQWQTLVLTPIVDLWQDLWEWCLKSYSNEQIDISSDPRWANLSVTYWHVLSIRTLTTVYSCIKTDCYVSDYVNDILLVYLIYCIWDTDLNKSDDFLLDPFCIYTIYVIFCFVFSIKTYTNKVLFKLNLDMIPPYGHAQENGKQLEQPEQNTGASTKTYVINLIIWKRTLKKTQNKNFQ